jgi:hypothetical protein
MTVEAIKDAIAALPVEDRHHLACWLNELDYDAWHQQMVDDFSPGGLGTALVERIQHDSATRPTQPLTDCWEEVRRKPPSQ